MSTMVYPIAIVANVDRHWRSTMYVIVAISMATMSLFNDGNGAFQWRYALTNTLFKTDGAIFATVAIIVIITNGDRHGDHW